MQLRIAALAALLASTTAYNVARQDITIDEDTTVTVTTTEEGDVQTVTADPTTVFKTVFSTVVVTSTAFFTETVTSRDVETGTKTVYVTITQAAKRWIDGPAAAPAATPPPVTLTDDSYAGQPTNVDYRNIELLIRRGILAKRATITVIETVIEDITTTITPTVTKTVVSTTSSETVSTSTLTDTTFLNAKTTVTITSTLVIRATTVTAGPAETVDSVPPGANIGTETAGPEPTDGADEEGGGGGGLSTGAKAGIGAACGVVGLAVLAGVAYYFYKQLKSKPRVVDDGLGAGMSEVPVGGIGPAAAVASSRHSRLSRTPEPSPKPPLSGGAYGYQGEQQYQQQQYQDQRHSRQQWEPAGPAELGGTAKPPTAEMGGDELPRFPEAGQQQEEARPQMGHTSGPVGVYEMPAHNYGR